MKINSNYNNLEKSYLFSTINRKVAEYTAAHPEANVIKLGIGDVTRPLCPAVIDALHGAVSEMGVAETFRGYGDEQGYGFLSDAITEYYAKKGVTLEKGEVFISDGAKSDCGNILDLFSTDNTVLVPDPVYPVYVDTNVMAGRKITYMSGSEENGFLPMPESATEKADIIYLCSPNNPTGAVYNKAQLEEWVAYANANDSIILFDSAYEAFIDDEELPTSIYEIEGAKTCAIELCSFSKTAGFTGTRCGYTVVPKALVREGASINAMWLRRQTTKFNGVPYIVQRGAEAVFSAEGYAQTRADLAYYKENAKIIASTFDELGITYFGGVHSPYIWMKTPDGMTSWEFFDKLLEEANVVGTPGSGFGKAGEGYFRLTAFNTKEKTLEAMERFKKLYNK